MMKQFNKMEREVITAMLKKEYPKLSDLWHDRYFVKEREFTGVGFFSHFSERDLDFSESENIFPPSDNRTILSSVSATLNKKVAVGFVLFTENGHIDCLEGYTYGGDSWPESIESYEIFIE